MKSSGNLVCKLIRQRQVAIRALILSYDRHVTGRRYIQNVAHMRTVLRQMSSRPGSHDQRSGHGTINPMRVFMHHTPTSCDAVYRLFQSEE